MVLVSTAGFSAEVMENPYQAIAARNPFHLVSPAVRRPELPPPPPLVLPRIVMTGVTDVCGSPQVLMEIGDPGKPAIKPVLREGEGEPFSDVLILGIDVHRGEVRIRCRGQEQLLVFGAPPPAAGQVVGRGK